MIFSVPLEHALTILFLPGDVLFIGLLQGMSALDFRCVISWFP
jgi:hypothetical protein